MGYIEDYMSNWWQIWRIPLVIYKGLKLMGIMQQLQKKR